jgi:hypothetical protein
MPLFSLVTSAATTATAAIRTFRCSSRRGEAGLIPFHQPRYLGCYMLSFHGSCLAQFLRFLTPEAGSMAAWQDAAIPARG